MHCMLCHYLKYRHAYTHIIIYNSITIKEEQTIVYMKIVYINGNSCNNDKSDYKGNLIIKVIIKVII